MKKNELRRVMKKGDFIIIALIITVSFIWFLFPLLSDDNLRVNIYLDGELELSRELSSFSESEEITLKGCRIRLSSEGAAFISSECPDGLCVRRGELKRAGDIMACVPEGVTLEIKGSKNNVHGISY